MWKNTAKPMNTPKHPHCEKRKPLIFCLKEIFCTERVPNHYFYNMSHGRQLFHENIPDLSGLTGEEKLKLAASLIENARESESGNAKVHSIQSLEEEITQHQGIREEKIMSGLSGLDFQYGGIKRAELITLASGTGMGKSSLLRLLAMNMSNNHKVLWVNLEEDAETMLKNLMDSAAAQVGWDENILPPEMARAHLLLKKLHVIHAPGLHFSDLLHTIQEHIEKEKTEVLFIDSLTFLYLPQKRLNRNEEINIMMRRLHALTRKYRTTIFISTHLNRKADRFSTAGLDFSALRDSGTIEIYSDKLFFLHKSGSNGIKQQDSANGTEDELQLILVKNRNGSMGELKFKYRMHPLRIKDDAGSDQWFDIPEHRMRKENEIPF
jgi:replicative DNA helicase